MYGSTSEGKNGKISELLGLQPIVLMIEKGRLR